MVTRPGAPVRVAATLVLATALALSASVLPACAPTRPRAATPQAEAPAEPRRVDLAFCSQLLCVLPFEVAKNGGFFAAEGLDVNLIYMKGGPAAVNALAGGSVHFISASMEAVLQAIDQERDLVLLNSTIHLPLFALVTSPQRAEELRSAADLEGRRVGVGNLGTADHVLAQYLVTRHGLNPERVEFVPLGPNIFEALRRGQVDAAMVQEPALTLIAAEGGRVLVNLMKTDEAERWLGGRYQHMGLVTRPDVLVEQADTAARLVRALARAMEFIHQNPGAEIVRYVPADLVPGGDPAVLAGILDRVKHDFYGDGGRADPDAVARVVDVLHQAGLVKRLDRLDPGRIVDDRFVPGSGR